jgi:hypothetical protein
MLYNPPIGILEGAIIMKKTVIILLTFILVLVLFAGCKPKALRGIDANGNRIEVQGDTVTVESQDGTAKYTSGGDLSWPTDKMGSLPKFNGNIISMWDTDDGICVNLDGVSKSDYEAYIQKLKEQGYETTYEATLDQSTRMFSGSKGDSVVSIQFFLDSDGSKGTVLIIYANA